MIILTVQPALIRLLSINPTILPSSVWICMDLHELPPTVHMTMEKIIIPLEETVKISCTLDISERLKQKLIKNKTVIKNRTPDLAT